MGKKSELSIPVERIERAIVLIRGQKVMLDADLASLYGVATKHLVQAIKRNRERFPDDFAFLLTQQEFANLRSQTVTSSSSWGGRRCDQLWRRPAVAAGCQDGRGMDDTGTFRLLTTHRRGRAGSGLPRNAAYVHLGHRGRRGIGQGGSGTGPAFHPDAYHRPICPRPAARLDRGPGYPSRLGDAPGRKPGPGPDGSDGNRQQNARSCAGANAGAVQRQIGARRCESWRTARRLHGGRKRR